MDWQSGLRDGKIGSIKKTKDKQQRIKALLESRQKVLERIKEIDAIFKEEKENEDFWPGHEGTRYQTADSDYQVLLSQLALIDKELENLGVNLKDYEKGKNISNLLKYARYRTN